MPLSQLIPAFNAGELSPYLDARTTLEKYASGCRTLENFTILPYGGAMRDAGTEFIGKPKFDDKKFRLIRFNYSTNTRFQLEFGDGYVRFWSNGVQVVKSSAPAWTANDGGGPPVASSYVAGQYVTESATIYYCLISHTTAGVFATDLAAGKWIAQTIMECFSPYLEADLFAVQFVQINDVMFLTHPLYVPQKISRIADDDWTFDDVDFDWPALLDENATAMALAPTATTGNITITTNSLGGPFKAGHVGSVWQIAHERDSASLEKTFAADGDTSGIQTLGDWELTTYGVWAGTLLLQRSFDNGSSWGTIRSYNSKSDRNVSATGTEASECLLRLSFINRTVGTAGDRAFLELNDSKQYGLVRITGFTNSGHVSATVLNDLAATTATTHWAEPAWSEIQGYPRVVALHESRIIYAGTLRKPQGIWGSAIDDFQNFRRSVLDDGSFFFELASPESHAVQWAVSQNSLIVGTSGSEWTIGGTGPQDALTPTNVRALQQSSYGSSSIAGIAVNDVILFVQKSGRKVRELIFDFGKDGWVAGDLSVLAEHITKSGIVEMAVQRNRDSILWAVRNDGQLIGLTYERDQQVVGWHRHVTDGSFESVSVIYGNEGSDDEVWLAVKRTIGGVTKRFIERIRPGVRDAVEDEDKSGWWFAHCAAEVLNGPASTTLSGLDHLEGKEVCILGDGAPFENQTVTGGAVTIGSAVSRAVVGLPYTSTLKPMRLNIDLQNGSSRGKKGKIFHLFVQFLNSLGGEFTTSGTTWNAIQFRDISDAMDSSPPPFSGEKEVYSDSNYSRDIPMAVRQTQPLPMTIVALVPEWEVTGP